MDHKELKLAIVGLGYVGLPLAVEFVKKRSVVAFDIDKTRIMELQEGFDRTLALNVTELKEAKELKYTYDPKDLLNCNCYIITVPTPVDDFNEPDLSALFSASTIVGNVLSKGDIVIYETTVYPGATEEDCSPILSKVSGLSYSTKLMPVESDVFYLGYSPERINPGDNQHRLTDIVKVTSGSTPEIAQLIDNLYASIIKAGTHKAESIRIAEAAKVIENTQRDVNIALINELAIIFNKLEIDTEKVLKAAGTKWNFLPFRPGLVGGHCIGVDPYYLTHKALKVGHKPEVILAGRNVNDSMAYYAAERLYKLMLNRKINISKSRVLVLGLSFKENCPDIRNSKVIDMIKSLRNYKCKIDIYDPWVKKEFLPLNFKKNFIQKPKINFYDAIILAVGHHQFIREGAKSIRTYGKKNHVFFDLKYAFDASETDERL